MFSLNYTFFKAGYISVSEPTGFLHKILVLRYVGQKRKSCCFGLQSPVKPSLLYLNSICGISTNDIFLFHIIIFSLQGVNINLNN